MGLTGTSKIATILLNDGKIIRTSSFKVIDDIFPYVNNHSGTGVNTNDNFTVDNHNNNHNNNQSEFNTVNTTSNQTINPFSVSNDDIDKKTGSSRIQQEIFQHFLLQRQLF